MRYISTRGTAPVLTFGEAMMTGLARDGGLYVPETVPVMAKTEIAALAGLPYEEVAFRVMKPFIGGFFADDEFKGLIAAAYKGFGHTARAPLVQLGPNHFLLELFHGPTLAFKDFAMQLIGQMMQAALAKTGERITIVGATSGDTGSAAMEAFKGLANVDLFIMYPHGRVSDVQRRQMTTPAEANVHALAVDGDFDDCQANVKAMFNDVDFRDGVRLAGVNSINWARVLAQVVYYFSSAVSLGAPHRAVSFTVPTGNFGDIFAGLVAKRMGLPIDRLIIATNVNDILDRTLRTGRYEMRGVTVSSSPSMDIQVSSNFERLLFEVHGRDPYAVRHLMAGLAQSGAFTIGTRELDQIRHEFSSGTAGELETARMIRETLAATGELLDPHSAVGYFVARGCETPDSAMVTLATAHPAKFPDAVEKACGIRPALPARLAGLMTAEERFTVLPNDVASVRDFILTRQQA